MEKEYITENDLKPEFLSLMKEQTGAEYDAFIASFSKPRHCGLQRNVRKTGGTSFREDMPFLLEPVTWCGGQGEGYYYEPESHPGKHPYHEAGVYYIQEPSAMMVAALLAPKPGERVLDLCAAPGGKSIQLAGYLQGEGLLVSNEINPERCSVLSGNIERMGIANCIVTNESSGRLADSFRGFFDRILVDAPCSGEGMMHRDETARKQWSMELVLECRDRQLTILGDAAVMLKPGGTLVYSTCTFNHYEDEDVVSEFIASQIKAFHTEFDLVETKRIWPHRDRGEGHFAAKLKKN